jgi:hypothetical protein
LHYIRSDNVNENKKVLKILEDNLFMSDERRQSHKELLDHINILKKSGKIRKNNIQNQMEDDQNDDEDDEENNILDDIDDQENNCDILDNILEEEEFNDENEESDNDFDSIEYVEDDIQIDSEEEYLILNNSKLFTITN